MSNLTKKDFPDKCGYVGIVGRPNAGKSTLLNHIIGQKLCITSRKPQTSRHNILGVKNIRNSQLVFIDTPGMHKDQTSKLNKIMNKSAKNTILDADVILFVVDRLDWDTRDDYVVEHLRNIPRPIICVVNKLDLIKDKNLLLPHMRKIKQMFEKVLIVPVSALKNQYLVELENEIVECLPQQSHFFPPNQITDKSERFFCAEIVREKVIRQLGNELPYQTSVDIDRFEVKENITFIDACIFVERRGQKKIIIGDKGQKLKKIGEAARSDIEKLIQEKVMLKIWVKVRNGWSNSDDMLKNFNLQ